MTGFSLTPKQFFTNLYTACQNNHGFGDSVRFLSYMAHYAEMEDMHIQVCPPFNRDMINKQPIPHVYKNLEDILSIMKPLDKGSIRLMVPDHQPALIINAPSHEYYPAYKTYVGGDDDLVCYQFDGMYNHETKNLSATDQIRIIRYLHSNYNAIRLGNHMSIQENIDYLIRCKFLIGVCSGMAHLAHMTRTPVILFKQHNSMYKLQKMHGFNPYTICDSVDDFIKTRMLQS